MKQTRARAALPVILLLAGCGARSALLEVGPVAGSGGASTHSTSTSIGGGGGAPNPFAALCTGYEHWTALGHAEFGIGSRSVWTGDRLAFAESSAVHLYDPLAGTWQHVEADPEAHGGGVGAWAGERIVWWGGGPHKQFLQSGEMFDPVTSKWTPTSITGAPSARSLAMCVSTGSEVIVWGGLDDALSPLGSGAVLDVATNTWRSMTTAGALSPRFYSAAVWTGDRMLLWGGESVGAKDGVLYDPATDTWSPVTGDGAPQGKNGPLAVWTGTRALIWGAPSKHPGGIYDPATDTWALMTTKGAPADRSSLFTMPLWTGSRLLIAGGDVAGYGEPPSQPLAALYDPEHDTWTEATTAGSPFESDVEFLVSGAAWLGCAALYVGVGGTDGTPQLWLYEPPPP